MPGSGSANVRSLDTLRDVRAALARFEERASIAVGGLRMEIQRMLEWLEQDRPAYWRQQVRDTHDEIASARIALENCRRRSAAGHRPTCIDEQRALERAKRKLQYAQEKVETVRRWSFRVRQAADEYRGRSASFERSLEHDVPKMLALLERMIAAVEDYADVREAQQPTRAAAAGTAEQRGDTERESGEQQRPVQRGPAGRG